MNPIRIHPSAMRRRATLLLVATWLGLHAPLWAQRLDPATLARPTDPALIAAWMMSPSGQATHNGEGRASSVLGNLPGTLTAPEISSVRVDVTTEKVAGEYRALIDMFDRLFN